MDLPPPSLEPNASRETETPGKDDQDWMSALRESVSFGRFLSNSLEWDTTRHVLPAPTTSILHDQSLSAAGLNEDVHVNFSVPTTMVGAQSASSDCGAACIGDSGAGVSCSPCLPAARSSTNIEGAALHLSMMEPMESIGQSVGSTTPVVLEHDANTNFKDGNELASCSEDSYSTPRKTSSMLIRGSTYEPECDESLQPTIGMVFDKWEDGEVFYKHYAHEAGFSVRIFTQHKGDGGVPVWKRFVCARQG